MAHTLRILGSLPGLNEYIYKNRGSRYGGIKLKKYTEAV